MKLIIDIPEEEYNTGQLIHYFGCYSDKLDLVIAHGKPLEKIIGTEILKTKQNITVGKEDYNMGIYVGLIKALNLFEDKESEE